MRERGGRGGGREQEKGKGEGEGERCIVAQGNSAVYVCTKVCLPVSAVWSMGVEGVGSGRGLRIQGAGLVRPEFMVLVLL